MSQPGHLAVLRPLYLESDLSPASYRRYREDARKKDSLRQGTGILLSSLSCGGGGDRLGHFGGLLGVALVRAAMCVPTSPRRGRWGMGEQPKPAGATAHGKPAKGDHAGLAKSQSPKSTRRTFKGSRIRVPIFVLLVVGFSITGGIFISLATPGTESANLLLTPPLCINAFATGATVIIRL